VQLILKVLHAKVQSEAARRGRCGRQLSELHDDAATAAVAAAAAELLLPLRRLRTPSASAAATMTTAAPWPVGASTASLT
jgi:hypothetical protein